MKQHVLIILSFGEVHSDSTVIGCSFFLSLTYCFRVWNYFCAALQWQASYCILMSLICSVRVIYSDCTLSYVFMNPWPATGFQSVDIIQITDPVLRRTFIWVKGQTSLDIDMWRKVGRGEELMQHRFEGAQGLRLDAKGYEQVCCTWMSHLAAETPFFDQDWN